MEERSKARNNDSYSQRLTYTHENSNINNPLSVIFLSSETPRIELGELVVATRTQTRYLNTSGVCGNCFSHMSPSTGQTVEDSVSIR